MNSSLKYKTMINKFKVNFIYLKNRHHPRTSIQMPLYFCLVQLTDQMNFFGYNLNIKKLF